MKLKYLFDNTQLTILTLGMAGLMAGCCTKSTGGSYSQQSTYTAAAGGTAETTEYQPGGTQVLPLYKEQLNVGTRQVDDGTVRIRKIVKTETVNQPITLRRETVTIDREPAATGQSDTSQAFQNQEITIQLHHDEPMIQKEVVPAGQIVAKTQSQTEQRNIQEQVRRDSVAIDKGNAQNVTISEDVTKLENENEPMGGGGEVGGQASASASGPITDVTVLTSCQDPNSLNGRQVQLNIVKVDRIKGQTLVIKDSSGKQCFVKLNQPMPDLQPGAQVNITGTVTQLSPTSDTEANEQIPQGSVCIQAQSVQLAQ